MAINSFGEATGLDKKTIRSRALVNLKKKKELDNFGAKAASPTQALKKDIAAKARQVGPGSRSAERNGRASNALPSGKKKNIPGVFGANQKRGYNPDNTLAKTAKVVDDIAKYPYRTAKSVGKTILDTGKDVVKSLGTPRGSLAGAMAAAKKDNENKYKSKPLLDSDGKPTQNKKLYGTTKPKRNYGSGRGYDLSPTERAKMNGNKASEPMSEVDKIAKMKERKARAVQSGNPFAK